MCNWHFHKEHTEGSGGVEIRQQEESSRSQLQEVVLHSVVQLVRSWVNLVLNFRL